MGVYFQNPPPTCLFFACAQYLFTLTTASRKISLCVRQTTAFGCVHFAAGKALCVCVAPLFLLFPPPFCVFKGSGLHLATAAALKKEEKSFSFFLPWESSVRVGYVLDLLSPHSEEAQIKKKEKSLFPPPSDFGQGFYRTEGGGGTVAHAAREARRGEKPGEFFSLVRDVMSLIGKCSFRQIAIVSGSQQHFHFDEKACIGNLIST